MADPIDPSLCGYADSPAVVPDEITPEDYCASGNATQHSGGHLCNCLLPDAVLTNQSEVVDAALRELATSQCCSQTYTTPNSDHVCGCIPKEMPIEDHDIVGGWVVHKNHCCSRTGTGHLCHCAPVGTQLHPTLNLTLQEGRHQTDECCSGVAQDGVCACIVEGEDIPDSGSTTSCCSGHETTCGCIVDGVLLQPGTPDTACCSNHTAFVLSDLCQDPPRKCNATGQSA